MNKYDDVYRSILEKVKAIPSDIQFTKIKHFSEAQKRRARSVYDGLRSQHEQIENNPLILIEALMEREVKHDYLIRKELGTHGALIEAVFEKNYIATSKDLFSFTQKQNLDQHGFFWGGTGVYKKDNKLVAYIEEREKTILDLKNTTGEILIIPEITGSNFCPTSHRNLIETAQIKVIFQDKKTGNINIHSFQAARDIENIRLKKFLITKTEYKDNDEFYIHDLPFMAGSDVTKVISMFYNEVPIFQYVPESKKPKIEAVVEAKPISPEIKPVVKVAETPTPAPEIKPEEKKKKAVKPKIKAP